MVNEPSFGELGSLRSRGVGRCGTPKESISYGSLELKIHPKVSLLRPKTMLKNFLNNSKNNFEKVKKSTFLNPKMVKNDPSNRPK